MESTPNRRHIFNTAPDKFPFYPSTRFDDVIEYSLPDESLRIKLLQNRLAGKANTSIKWKRLVTESSDLSHAEITRACDDALKEAIIHDSGKITQKALTRALADRRKYHSRIFSNPSIPHKTG